MTLRESTVIWCLNGIRLPSGDILIFSKTLSSTQFIKNQN